MTHRNKVTDCYPSGITFESYSADEILKLSVAHVRNPQSFDVLGHPTKGGVYDPAMGPNERDELCATCHQSHVHCLGHFGHVQLALPVFNPVFYDVLVKILRGSCFRCHRLTHSGDSLSLAALQLELLGRQMFVLAQELEDLVEAAEKGFEKRGVTKKLQLYIDVLDRPAQDDELRAGYVKNTVDLRSTIIRRLLLKCSSKKRCPHCKTSKNKIVNVNKTRLLSSPAQVGGAPKKPGRKKRQKEGADEPDPLSTQEPTELENGKCDSNITMLTPFNVHKHLRHVWEKNKAVLHQVFKILDAGHPSPMDLFMLKIIPVPPSRFRPINTLKEKKYENPQSAVLGKVVQSNYALQILCNLVKAQGENADPSIALPTHIQNLLDKIQGANNAEKLNSAWSSLQAQVNLIFSTEDVKENEKSGIGVKQLIEKKEGLFRSNMMGKRVNYAARSVISPDPLIGIIEIGIPEVFAKRLTYPQAVTPWNVRELRTLVVSGPENYPGAISVENEYGLVTLLSKNKTQREAIAKTLLTPSLGEDMKGCKIVYRHLKNGDAVLLNRQPTLHRPSIMAHKVRVLPGDKTLRLHYSNCKTYNADFDGDEMNVHLPQNEMARAEAELIVNVANHYLVPKDGTPLGGLIQDHIIAGVQMTMRGKFFSREDYQQLVTAALADKVGIIRTLSPAIIAPGPFWSGKQVLSTVIMNMIPEGKEFISLDGSSKIGPKIWENCHPRPWKAGGSAVGERSMGESEVIVRQGELLCGVLDKAHYGPTPFGLIHCCYELYGGTVSSQILTAMGRLFTYYLQLHGFTLGVEDILVVAKADKKRRKIMRHSQKGGLKVATEAFDVEGEAERSIHDQIEAAHRSLDQVPMQTLDMHMKQHTDKTNDDVNRILMPKGLLKQFPYNNLQLMVQSGAKGTSVNTMQISSMLGQIELEGRRPPLMLSGRSLPSFLVYDTRPRAGGFVDGRFLTGIQPQEYFFHCMAGREGLIDTAVKTSRSGYLQRCLIKHLEGLKVHYDMTVRDSDGSVIQYLYGEDGLDIQKISFLKARALPFLHQNIAAVYNKSSVNSQTADGAQRKIRKQMKKIRKLKDDRSGRCSPYLYFCLDNELLSPKQMQEAWFKLDESGKTQYFKRMAKCPDPVVAKYRPDLHVGAITETLDELIETYVQHHGGTYAHQDSDACPSFKTMMDQKIRGSLCHPGEAVGLLAAQSIGEPSTQMTLNTFHFAGRGEMNVTLGIPRLREILMTASARIATPAMELPFREGVSADDANALKLKLTKVYFSQVLESIHVFESLSRNVEGCFRMYEIKFNFISPSLYCETSSVTSEQVYHFIKDKFLGQLAKVVNKKLDALSVQRLVETEQAPRVKSKQNHGGDDDDDDDGGDGNGNTNEDEADVSDSDDDDRGDHDGDASESRRRARRNQEREYDSEDESEEAMASDVEEGADDESEDESDSEVDEKKVKTQSNPKKKKLQNSGYVHNFKYDKQDNRWCEMTLKLPTGKAKVDMMSILDVEVKRAVVHEVPSINRAFVTESKNVKYLKTDGVNIIEMFKYNEMLDVNRLYSNDIHAIANMYGIEAAARVIVKEVQAVFGVYGIEVDPRHLLLVADYMAFSGQYSAFNRIGLVKNSSPLQQMTFETTMQFLKTATLDGRPDDLTSPSAQIVLGRPVGLGTGATEMLVNLI